MPFKERGQRLYQNSCAHKDSCHNYHFKAHRLKVEQKITQYEYIRRKSAYQENKQTDFPRLERHTNLEQYHERRKAYTYGRHCFDAVIKGFSRNYIHPPRDITHKHYPDKIERNKQSVHYRFRQYVFNKLTLDTLEVRLHSKQERWYAVCEHIYLRKLYCLKRIAHWHKAEHKRRQKRIHRLVKEQHA